MRKLMFVINREFIRLEIKDREIYYSDRMWTKAIRLIPKDKEFEKKVILSRNRIPSFLMNLFRLNNEELQEYNNAKTEEELVGICIKDCQKKGAVLISNESIANL